MQLSQLSLNGFKSFGNPVTIEFVSGINAIVGPNGSGKSNIIDGLRWATGGGRASEYRADAKTDLIFHGASGKKSLSFAEVEIEIKNNEKTIKIARRMLRDGNIRLRLNGRNSKFKDVFEELSGSGLGRGNLAIIGQGEVSQVLTASKDRLLAYVAEAANVAILSQRRDQALARLETAQEHLIRLQDIIINLESQLESLREAAREAERFNQLSKESLELRYSLSVKRVEGLEQELVQLNSKEQQLVEGLEQNQSKLQETQLAWKVLRTELKTLESNYRQALMEAEAKKGDLRVAEERVKAAQERLDSLAREQAAGMQEIKRLESLKEPQLVQEDLGMMQEQIKKLKQNLEEQQNENSELSLKLQNSREELELMRLEIAKEDQAVTNYQFKSEQLNEQYHSIEQRLASLDLGINDDVEALQKEVSRLEDRQIEQNKELENLRDELTQAVHKHAGLHAKAAGLEQTARRARAGFESRSGYAKGPKIALSSGISGIIGSVADLIIVPDKYRTAVAAALGRRAEYIVVDTAKTAQELIKYVKNAGAWITVLPLDLISAQKPSLDAAVAKQAGIIGLLTELVETEARFDKLLNQLLGRTALVDNMQNAVRIAKKFSQRPRLLTIDGNIIESYGAMSGGRNRVSNTVIGAASDVEAAEEEAQKAKHELESIAKIVAKLQEKTKESQKNLVIIRADLNSKLKELSKARESFNISNSLNDVLGKQLIDIREQLLALAKPVNKVDRSIYKALQEKHNELQERYENLAPKLKRANDEYQQQREQLILFQERKERFDADLQRYKQEMSRMIGLQANLATLKEEKLKQEEILNEARVRQKLAQEAMPKDLEQKKQVYEKTGFEAQDKEKALNELSRKQAEISAQLEDTRLKQARRETALEIAKEEKLKFPPGIRLLEDSARVCRTRLNYVENELENIGPINHRAAQDLAEKQEKYDDLQVDTVQATLAVSELEAVLERIDKETNSRVAEATSAMRIKFKEYVKELFGQDAHAEINVHRDEDRITGLSIDLQPPGKKTKSLNLLSVGERTMGAMAFLFSLMQSDGGQGLPIAILDEVDAPLDEANIRRYTRFVQFMARKGTQFVLITHQKATFDVADVLWGITSDKGISRVFSISKKDYILED